MRHALRFKIIAGPEDEYWQMSRYCARRRFGFTLLYSAVYVI